MMRAKIKNICNAGVFPGKGFVKKPSKLEANVVVEDGKKQRRVIPVFGQWPPKVKTTSSLRRDKSLNNNSTLRDLKESKRQVCKNRQV
jgi:hypothetical protein